MLKIIWRNIIGYIVESSISYRVYFTHHGGIIQCFPLTTEGLEKAKGVLVAARERAIAEREMEVESNNGY